MSYDNLEFLIPDVNSDKGLDLCRRNKKIYVQSLRLFAANIPVTLSKMRTLLQQGELSEKDLKNYAINAHSVKGMCVYIGAEESEKEAKNLEKLADNGDIKSIREQNESFIKQIEKIINNINIWFSNNKELEPNNG